MIQIVILKETVEIIRQGFMDKPTAELEADVIPGDMDDNKKEGSDSCYSHVTMVVIQYTSARCGYYQSYDV